MNKTKMANVKSVARKRYEGKITASKIIYVLIIYNINTICLGDLPLYQVIPRLLSNICRYINIQQCIFEVLSITMGHLCVVFIFVLYWYFYSMVKCMAKVMSILKQLVKIVWCSETLYIYLNHLIFWLVSGILGTDIGQHLLGFLCQTNQCA